MHFFTGFINRLVAQVIGGGVIGGGVIGGGVIGGGGQADCSKCADVMDKWRK